MDYDRVFHDGYNRRQIISIIMGCIKIDYEKLSKEELLDTALRSVQLGVPGMFKGQDVEGVGLKKTYDDMKNWALMSPEERLDGKGSWEELCQYMLEHNDL
jgi:hypothetical protein